MEPEASTGCCRCNSVQHFPVSLPLLSSRRVSSLSPRGASKEPSLLFAVLFFLSFCHWHFTFRIRVTLNNVCAALASVQESASTKASHSAQSMTVLVQKAMQQGTHPALICPLLCLLWGTKPSPTTLRLYQGLLIFALLWFQPEGTGPN